MDNLNSLILVGGKSRAGKTTLLNALISLYPEIYSRPISYTTRFKRMNENSSEYRFITIEEFKKYEAQGEFLNVDQVFGNYYAMKNDSIMDLMNKGKCAIKEIHPRNFKKIKQAFSGRCLTVLIKSSNKGNGEDDSRMEDDQAYYQKINENYFDILFYYDINATPEKNARYFHQKISVTLSLEEFPLPGEIDDINRKGYGGTASCFTEEKRITTRNFHELSEDFFLSTFANYVESGKKVLEIGPGHGWLYKTTQPNCLSYTCLDISQEMTEKNPLSDKIISSVRCIPIQMENYDIVVASLADPYFYPEAICEISRVLKVGGFFIFSLPAHAWANALRTNTQKKNMTSFILDSGETVEVFSFTFSEDKLIALLDQCSFICNTILTQKGGSLIGREISPAITIAVENSRTSLDQLDIVTMAIFKKTEVY